MTTAASPRIRARSRQKRCYELAGRGQMRAPDWLLVHGTVTWDLGDGTYVRFPHAWLELNAVVYCPTVDKFFSKKDYRRIHRARPWRRFTSLQAARMMLKHGVYGPFATPVQEARMMSKHEALE